MAPQPLQARGSQAGLHPGGVAQAEDLDLPFSCLNGAKAAPANSVLFLWMSFVFWPPFLLT